jgi:hypothetical protein
MKQGSSPSSTVSLMDSNPQEAWALLAKLEFEGPGGMTGLPVLLPTLSDEDRRKMKRPSNEGERPPIGSGRYERKAGRREIACFDSLHPGGQGEALCSPTQEAVGQSP